MLFFLRALEKKEAEANIIVGSGQKEQQYQLKHKFEIEGRNLQFRAVKFFDGPLYPILSWCNAYATLLGFKAVWG